MSGIPFLVFLVSALATVVAAKYTGPTNEAGLEIIKNYEGFSANFYNNSNGKRTIGYGHDCNSLPCSVPLYGKYGVPLTLETAEELLLEDLGPLGGFESCVNYGVTYDSLSANQFSALVSFVYNVGCQNFGSSALLDKLNGGDLAGAGNEFGKWIYSGNKRAKHLTWRRASEMYWFCTVESDTEDVWLCD